MMKAEPALQGPNGQGVEPSVRSRRRKLVVFGLKLVVSALLIAWILHAEDVTAVLGALRGADRGLVTAAFLVYAATYHIRARRWQLLLGANGVHAGIPFLIRSYLVSVFFSNFLPSTVGGDVVRVYDSWKAGTTKTAALTVIFVDRFLGVVALLVFAAGALLLSPTARSAAWFITPAVLLATAMAGLLLWLLFLPGRASMDVMERLRSIAGNRFSRLSEPLFAALQAFHGQHRVLAVTIIQSLVFQAMIVVHYLLIARALQIGIPAADFFWIIPTSILVMMLPVSINAIGVREHVFVYFFAAYAVSGSEAVAFAWLSYGVVLALGVIGGVLNMTRK
jgi:glycosyltransferase 2 family protein